MDNEFSLALRKIKEVDPKGLVEQVFQFFSLVNYMDEQTIIAAYQTLILFRSGVSLEDRETLRRYSLIEKPMIDRMFTLVLKTSSDKRQATALSFKEVVREAHHDRFNELLRITTPRPWP